MLGRVGIFVVTAVREDPAGARGTHSLLAAGTGTASLRRGRPLLLIATSAAFFSFVTDFVSVASWPAFLRGRPLFVLGG